MTQVKSQQKPRFWCTVARKEKRERKGKERKREKEDYCLECCASASQPACLSSVRINSMFEPFAAALEQAQKGGQQQGKHNKTMQKYRRTRQYSQINSEPARVLRIQPTKHQTEVNM